MHLTSIKTSTVTAILLASMLLLACGEQTSSDDSEKNSVMTNGTQAAAVTEEKRWTDHLPEDLDLGGETITIHVRGDETSTLEVNVDSEEGEILSDAIYHRNRDIEERLNVTIATYIGAGWESYMPELTKVQASIAAGDNAWQAIASWSNHATPLALENCFWDLQEIDYIDMSQPWWNQAAVEGMTLGGRTYFVTGDISILTTIGSSYVLFQNDRLVSANDIESIPALVRDGKWTLDKMTEIIKKVKGDLNGDGTMDENDLYGFVTDLHNCADTFYTACGIHQIVLKDGIPEYVPCEERISAMIDKIYPFFYGGSDTGSLLLSSKATTDRVTMFKSGQALLIPRELDGARTAFRDMDDSYTILPFPKLDEAQDRYYTSSYNSSSVWSIPSDNPNPSAAAAVLEAMAAESYASVTPTYFETCMQEKYARNEDTLEMLELIRQTSYLDCEYLYATSLGETYYVARNMISEKNRNAASYLAKFTKKYEKAVSKLVEKINDMEP